MRKMSLEDYERTAVKVGDCLVRSGKRLARRCYEWRHGKLPSHIAVCHTCDNPKCINDEHHFPGTWKDNVHDAVRKNRHSCCRRGDKSNRHVLTEQQAREIKHSIEPLRYYADKFGITVSAVSKIRTGRNWRWLT